MVLSKPKIFICVPFKDDRYLTRCLNSILELDYPKDRLTLCLIGDLNYSRKLHFADTLDGMTVIKDVEDDIGERNIPHARNKGLQWFSLLDKHEYFFSVDADVEVPKNALRLMLHHFAVDDNLFLDTAGSAKPLALVCIPYGYSKEELYLNLEKAEVNISLGCTLIKRKALEDISYRIDERHKNSDDRWLDFKLQKKGWDTFVMYYKRCLHLKPFDYKNHLKMHFIERPKQHLLFMQEGIAPRSMYFRYAFYGAIWLSMIFMIVGWFSYYLWMPILGWLLIFAFPILLILLFLGIYHYGFRRFLTWGLPLGLTLSLGMVLQICNPLRRRNVY